MRYITSDLHFYHNNILKFSPDTRPWGEVLEMNEALIETINSLSDCEVLYHLGDFAFCGPNKMRVLFDRIKVPMIQLLGNHDRHHEKLFKEYYETHYYKEIKHNGKKVCLFHYPMMEWNGGHRGSLHLFGHVHGRLDTMGKSLDVGWDAHGRILTLDEACVMADSFELYQPVH